MWEKALSGGQVFGGGRTKYKREIYECGSVQVISSDKNTISHVLQSVKKNRQLMNDVSEKKRRLKKICTHVDTDVTNNFFFLYIRFGQSMITF